MAGVWGYFIQICLTVPFLLTVAMLAPAPRKFRGLILQLVDKTLGLQFLGYLSLFHLMLLVTGGAFLNTCRETYALEGKASERHSVDLSPNVAYGNLGRKWRAERNFWIAFLCFFLWCLVQRLYQVLKKYQRMEDEVYGRGGGSSSPAPTKPAGGLKKAA